MLRHGPSQQDHLRGGPGSSAGGEEQDSTFSLLLPDLALPSHSQHKQNTVGKNSVSAEVAELLSPVVSLLEIHPK